MTEDSTKSLAVEQPKPSMRPESPSPFRPVPSTRRVNRQLIEPLLNRPERIRNVCILAHVDHGKTTLTDSLLASNGIISFKQAGTLRYMDAREDEQERGITMESSAVSLLYDVKVNGITNSPSTSSIDNTCAASRAKVFEGLSIGDRRFLINLIDSPGHVDFSSQVATAAKLCDGCLVLVDAVEGVCTQTAAVLRQAHKDRLTPCLVINKMDRLVTELKLNSEETAEWLFKLLAQVNAIQASVSQRMTEFDLDGNSDTYLSMGDEVFCPSKGNVIFASATDGWAFRIDQFAKLHSRRLEMKEDVLKQTLWGEYYLDTKGKRVVGKKGAEKLGLSKPMFAQFIIDNIWPIYEATSKDNWDQAKIEKIAHGLGVKLPLRELKTREGKSVLRSILTTWLPLAESAFAAIIAQLPDPIEANRIRIPALLHSTTDESTGVTNLSEDSTKFVENIYSKDTESNSPVVAYLSKQFAVTMREKIVTEDGIETVLNREKLVGMARLFHGSISVGQKIYVLSPKFRPERASPDTYSIVEVKELFLLMGRDLEPVDCVHSGNVFGIGGLEAVVGKSATLTDNLACPSFDCQKNLVQHLEYLRLRMI